MAKSLAYQRIVARRGKGGRTAEFTPKEAAYVDAIVTGKATSQLQAATIAGYADPVAHASAIAARPHIAAAIEDRRTVAQREADFDVAMLYRELMIVARDRDPENYSPKVRAIEVGLKAAGELGPDVRVNVDNRSVSLPAVDPERAAAAYGAMFASAEAPSPGLTDAGTVGGGTA